MKVRIKEKLKEKQVFSDYISKMAQEYNEDNEYLDDGTKVKLNYNEITTHPMYSKMRKEYRDFVENNKNTIFTVERNKKHFNSYMVCLKEDLSPIKWLWHSSLDLIVVDNDNTNEKI